MHIKLPIFSDIKKAPEIISRGLKRNLLFKVLLLMLQNLLGNGKITRMYVNKINSAAECDFVKDSFFF
jgi:hypothetical protein